MKLSEKVNRPVKTNFSDSQCGALTAFAVERAKDVSEVVRECQAALSEIERQLMNLETWLPECLPAYRTGAARKRLGSIGNRVRRVAG